MSDLFSGLEGFGLTNTDDINVYEKDDPKLKEEKLQKKEPTEEEFLFDKTFKCPVCDNEFTSKTVRTGRAKLLSADMDLRPKYKGVDSLKYDAVMCPKCGYAALNRYFDFVMSGQIKLIKEKISRNFKNPFKEGKIYTYDEAISRHKIALLTTIVKKGKNSERAYTCLKLAWLTRGKREELLKGEYDKAEIKTLEEEELELLHNAQEGFEQAFSTEDFPMCGMDQYTMIYLIAELYHRTGRYNDAMRWISKVLVARDAQHRIKDKARDLKELMHKERGNE